MEANSSQNLVKLPVMFIKILYLHEKRMNGTNGISAFIVGGAQCAGA